MKLIVMIRNDSDRFLFDDVHRRIFVVLSTRRFFYFPVGREKLGTSIFIEFNHLFNAFSLLRRVHPSVEIRKILYADLLFFFFSFQVFEKFHQSRYINIFLNEI